MLTSGSYSQIKNRPEGDMKKYRNIQHNLISLARYNIRIVFGGKFVYFILAAFGFFMLLGTIRAFDDN